MSSLELRVLGRFELREDGKAIALPGRKERALLTFLSMPAGRPHSRSQLASMLWGMSDERLARDSLRQAILRLRKSFGSSRALPLVADRESLMLIGDAVTVDALEFERYAREGTPSTLAEAAALYRGDLAEGLDGLDQVFDEWLLNERQRLHDVAHQVLSKLLDVHLRAGAHVSAAATARRLTVLDPIDELAHRALMQIYFQQGQHPQALRQYERCREVLRKEIGEEPEAETERLYRDIRQRRFITRWESGQTAPHPRPRGQSRLVERGVEPSSSSMAAASIAVPLFAPIGDAARDFIASGLTSDLSEKLSHVRGLRVVTGYSAARFADKGANIPPGSNELGADLVLSGSVRSFGGDLQITADLTDMRTGKILWQEKFNDRLDALFAFQDEIVAAVVAVTGTRLNIRDGIERGVDLECWAIMSRVWRNIHSYTPAGLSKGEEFAKQLIAKHPGFSEGYNALCYAKFHLLTMGFRAKEKEFVREIVHLAKQQVKLQPDSAWALRMLAMVLIDCEAQPLDALAVLHRTVEIDPGSPCNYGQMGDASVMAGRPEEALRLEKFAIDLDPQSIGNYFRYSAMASASFEMNDLEGAFQLAQRSIALKPDYVVTHAITAASLSLSGDLYGARHAVIAAKQYLPGISLESANELSLFRKEWSEPFQSGLAAAGIR